MWSARMTAVIDCEGNLNFSLSTSLHITTCLSPFGEEPQGMQSKDLNFFRKAVFLSPFRYVSPHIFVHALVCTGVLDPMC
jgi:hypothetical protein